MTGLTICDTQQLCPVLLETLFALFLSPTSPCSKPFSVSRLFVVSSFSSVIPFKIPCFGLFGPSSTPFEMTFSSYFFALSLLPLSFLRLCALV